MTKSLTKGEVIDAVCAKVEGLKKNQTGEIVDAVFAILGESICECGRFAYPGFGVFTVKERAAKNGRNPRTGEPLYVPASKAISFRMAPKLKTVLNPCEKAEEVKEEVKEEAAAKKCCKKSCKKDGEAKKTTQKSKK